MTSEGYANRKGWIDAAIALVNDPLRNVVCPSCGKAELSVQNLPSDEKVREKRIFCKACGRQEYVLMTPPEHLIKQK